MVKHAELDWLLGCEIEELIVSLRSMSAQTIITLQFWTYSLMSGQKMMSWADYHVSPCACANCGSKSILILPRIEQNCFILFAAGARTKDQPKQFTAGSRI